MISVTRVLRGSRPRSSWRAAAISAARMESPGSVLPLPKIEPIPPRRGRPMLPLPLTATDPLEDGMAVCAARKLAYHIAHPSVDVRASLDDAEGDWGGRTEEAPAIAGSICLSKRWSFAVFGSVRFPVGIAALDKPRIEPEALERCAWLRVPLFTSAQEAASATVSKGDRTSTDGAAATVFASARFDEEKIWTHYTNITGKIWFFEPVVSSTAGL